MRVVRKTIRLQNYDYTEAGAYFITICTWQREILFGKVVDGKMQLNPLGEIVQEEWLRTEQLRAYVVLDEFVVMPNHMHGILFIEENQPSVPKRARHASPLQNDSTQPKGIKPKSLGAIIGSFKSAATRRVNQYRSFSGHPLWQRNYWERVIRDEEELTNVRQYIHNNPLNWMQDENNPQNTKT